jgi:hypothetical protein
MAMPILARPSASQNSADPQLEQKPRRTFSDERNQLTCSEPVIDRSSRGMSVDAQ